VAVSAPRSGFRAFVILWSGQFVSLAGSGLSSFALGVYAYLHTGSVTTLGLVYALAYLPFVLASPFTGPLIDRWGPRRALVVSNAGAGIVMLALAASLAAGGFAVWHFYLVVSCISALGALETPAFESAVPALVGKRQLGRANGMRMLAEGAGRLVAPVAAGFLLLAIHVSGVILMDCLSYGVALLTLAAVRIPRYRESADAPAPRAATPAALLHDFGQAWRYIAARPGLVGLLVFTALVNFCGGFVQLLITPLVLALGSPAALGTVLSFAGIGMVVASVAMSAWGGPRRRIDGILGFSLLMGAAMIVGALRPDTVLIAAAGFVVLGSSAIVMACNQVVWQTKIEPRLLGRSMALLGMAFSAPQLLAFALAGLTADRVFVPLVGRHQVRSPVLQLLVGHGPGRGFALLIMLMGGLIMACVLGAALYPRLRHLDGELPDMTEDTDDPGSAGGTAGRPAPAEPRPPSPAITTTS
jgi:MFS transporter, DHA3 family, macrolide efflux protein